MCCEDWVSVAYIAERFSAMENGVWIFQTFVKALLANIVLKQQKRVKNVLADLGYREFFEEVVTQRNAPQKLYQRLREFFA